MNAIMYKAIATGQREGTVELHDSVLSIREVELSDILVRLMLANWAAQQMQVITNNNQRPNVP